MNITHINSAAGLDFGSLGWRYYNQIKKKAMEQEFSWSGLVLSLSIAFFIVVFSAFLLSLMHTAVVKTHEFRQVKQNIYQLEAVNSHSIENYLQVKDLGINQVEKIVSLNLT